MSGDKTPAEILVDVSKALDDLPPGTQLRMTDLEIHEMLWSNYNQWFRNNAPSA